MFPPFTITQATLYWMTSKCFPTGSLLRGTSDGSRGEVVSGANRHLDEMKAESGFQTSLPLWLYHLLYLHLYFSLELHPFADVSLEAIQLY